MKFNIFWMIYNVSYINFSLNNILLYTIYNFWLNIEQPTLDYTHIPNIYIYIYNSIILIYVGIYGCNAI